MCSTDWGSQAPLSTFKFRCFMNSCWSSRMDSCIADVVMPYAYPWSPHFQWRLMASSCHQSPPGLAHGRWRVPAGKCCLEGSQPKPGLGVQYVSPSPPRWYEVDLISPWGPHWDSASIASWGSLLDNASLNIAWTGCLSFSDSHLHIPVGVSWDHFPNKLLTPESLSQHLLLREFKLRLSGTEDQPVMWFWLAWGGGASGMWGSQC